MGTCLLALAVAALAGHTAPVMQATSQTQAAPVDATPTVATDVAPDGATATRYVDRAQLMRDVETLAAQEFEGRRTGTPGGLRARQWLVDQFEAIGLVSEGTEGYVQPFTFADRERYAAPRGGRPSRRAYSGANVIGSLAGRDSRTRTLVVTAHYDHLGVRDGVLYPGADDNASGVAALLAAARHFARNPPRRRIVFAALDAEELGLRGARALVDSPIVAPSEVALHVNLDMVGRSDRNEIYAAGTSHAPWLTPLLQDVQTRASVRILFGHDQPLDPEGREDWTHSSDHGPFHDAGIPFLYFGVEEHGDYHAATDTPDRIDRRFFGDVADMIVDALRTSDMRVE
jgi:Zn-dependent M28 family amino/carboxypeptidase